MADDPRIVGIAGTAKNTGKTTALNALVAAAHERRVPVAATSIGYDGETVDNVTGLPKPRIVLPPGSLATTARACVPAAGWEVLGGTGAWTALGEVLLARCLEESAIVLAGPNRRTELARVMTLMQKLGPSLTVVDGALNRLTPMSVASAFVLSTGAARSPDTAALVREASAVESLFRLPALPGEARGAAVPVPRPFPTLEELARAVAGRADASLALSFRLPVHPDVLSRVSDDRRMRGRVVGLSFEDPVLLLLCGEAVAMADALARCGERGIQVTLERPLSLAAVTVNPFLPRPVGPGWVADAVAAAELRDAMATSLRAPVVDVVVQGHGALWDAVAAAFPGSSA